MNLDLQGRKAIVCASSRGLGRACALALAAEGCDVVVNGRDEATLAATARDVGAANGGRVTTIVGDLGEDRVREALLAACPAPDILVNNNGGPPPRAFAAVTHDALMAGIEANMATPIALVQAVIEGMAARGFGRIINITSASVKMPLGGLDISSGARAGLTAFLGGVAREVASANVTINFILPGAFDTDRLKGGMTQAAQRTGKSLETVRQAREQAIPARRFGTPAEFGALCAFLASAQAGYITGQNFLIDGGAYPGTF